MNIQIFPKKQTETEKETAPVFQPFSQKLNSTKAASFFADHIFHLLSFFIPILLTLLLYQYKGIIPFGTLSIFQDTDFDKTTTLFYRFVSQLHSGSFSLLNPSGINDTTMGEIFPLYLSSPFTLLAAAFPLRQSLCMLSLLSVLRIALAGLFMFVYMTKRKEYTSSPFDPMTLVFSTAYSLSSYFIFQQIDYRYLDCAVFFPLLMLAYERMLYQKKSLFFYLLLVTLLFDSAPGALSAIALLLLYLLLTPGKDMMEHPVRRFFTTALLSLITAAPNVLFCLHTVFKYGDIAKDWPDFFCFSDGLSLFSRFLLNVDGSLAFTTLGGSNLYFSCFLLLLFFLSLFQSSISLRERIRRILFPAVILLFINIKPLNHLLSLASFERDPFTNYGYILVFFAILCCSNVLYQLKNIPIAAYLVAVALPTVLLLLSGVAAENPVGTSDLLIVFVFFVIYLLLLLFYRIGSIKRQFFLLLCGFLFFIELFLNEEHQLYNLTSDEISLDEQIKNFESENSLSFDPFASYDIKFSASEQLQSTILPEYYVLSGHYNLPKEKHLVFASANALYSSLGGRGELFEECDPEISINQPKSVKIRKDKQNIYYIDSSKYSKSYYFIYFTFTDRKGGELVISNPDISYIGILEPDKPLTVPKAFPSLTYHTSMLYMPAAYYNRAGLESLSQSLKASSPSIKHRLFSLEIPMSAGSSASDGQTLVIPIQWTHKLNVYADGQKALCAKGPADQTAIYLDQNTRIVQIKYPILPFALSIVYILLLAISCSFAISTAEKRTKRAIVTPQIKEPLISIKRFLSTHAVSIASFIVPFVILLIAACYSSYAPFGGSVYYKSDGAAMTMPNLYSTRDSLLQTIHSFSISNASLTSVFQLLISLLTSGWVLLFPAGSLIIPATFNSIIRTSFCGLTMYFYLTRRLYGRRLSTKSMHTLIFTTAYAISAYNLSFRQFIFWADIVAFFPLLLLSMDYLIIKKKIYAYTFFLAVCMIINTMNTIYLCVFLAMWFFVYKFDTFADFIKKGFLFAIASLFSAGLSFWVLAGNVSSRSESGYNAGDSVTPQLFKFYQSYFASLKQTFLFSEPVCVTRSNGAINLYCGLFLIILFALFILYGQKSKRKTGRILIAAIIFFSSNNDLMSYLWNGMHFQSKVPNRYSFLLIFLIIDLAVDGFSLLNRINRRQLIISSVVSGVFFAGISIYVAINHPDSPIIWTLLFVILYLLLLFSLPALSRYGKNVITAILCISLIVEVTLNACFVFKTDDYSDGQYIDMFSDVTNYLKENWLANDYSPRVTYSSSESVNQSLTNHVSSLGQFSSYTSENKIAFASSLGYYTSPNNVISTTNETPFTSAILNNEYFIVSDMQHNQYLNTDYYDVIAQYGEYLILHNPRTLSNAFYIPTSLVEDVKGLKSTIDLGNAFANAFVPGEEIYSRETDFSEEKIKESEGHASFSYSEKSEDSLVPLLSQIKFKTSEAGEYYYRSGEFFYLGELDGKTDYDYVVPAYDNAPGVLIRYQDDAFQKFYDVASEHMLNTTYHDGSVLEGTIDLPETGYILLSLPYDSAYKATIDGNPVEIEPFVNRAMMVKAATGSHTLHLEYTSVKQDTVILITLCFWFAYIILLCIKHRKVKLK